MGYKMNGSPHKMGTIIGASAFKQKKETKKEVEKHTTSGLPENLYDANGEKVNTTTGALDEGTLSEVKIEKETKRKYVEVLEGPREGEFLYFSKE